MRSYLPVLLAAFALGASAQEVRPGPGFTLYDVGGVAVAGPSRPLRAADARRTGPVTRVVTRRAATFEVDYAGFSNEAQAAFQYAVDIWAQYLDSSVPVRVEATFSDLEEGVLGSAGPNLIRETSGTLRGTWYPFALADALAGRDLSPAPGDFFYDIVATFSSARDDFYFGLDGEPPPGQFDFVTIVLHELGHGLGFLGSGDVDDGEDDADCPGGGTGAGCWGLDDDQGTTLPFIFDRFLDDANGVPMLDESVYPNPSLALGDLLESEALFVDGATVVGVYGEPAPVWAPAPFDRGSSFSHWDEVVIRGSSAALMTPQVARGEAYQDPGDITCAFFADMGWPLAAGCASLVAGTGPLPPPAPPVVRPDSLVVTPTGPNPFAVRTSFRVRTPEDGGLEAVLYDVLGREVARPFDGTAGSDETLRISASTLAAGVYVLVVRYGDERVERVLTVVR